jgi:hypothetical protein
MKLASLCVAALVILMGLAIVTGDGGPQPTLPDPKDQPPLSHEQYALLPVTGREVIEAMLADEKAGDSNELARDRHSRGYRSPEDQARGLSGSA